MAFNTPTHSPKGGISLQDPLQDTSTLTQEEKTHLQTHRPELHELLKTVDDMYRRNDCVAMYKMLREPSSFSGSSVRAVEDPQHRRWEFLDRFAPVLPLALFSSPSMREAYLYMTLALWHSNDCTANSRLPYAAHAAIWWQKASTTFFLASMRELRSLLEEHRERAVRRLTKKGAADVAEKKNRRDDRRKARRQSTMDKIYTSVIDFGKELFNMQTSTAATQAFRKHRLQQIRRDLSPNFHKAVEANWQMYILWLKVGGLQSWHQSTLEIQMENHHLCEALTEALFDELAESYDRSRAAIKRR